MSTIYATSFAVVAKSPDCGWRWEVVYPEGFPGGWDLMGVRMWFVKIDPNAPETVWAGGESMIFGPILSKSTNTGLDWNPGGIPYPVTMPVMISPFLTGTPSWRMSL